MNRWPVAMVPFIRSIRDALKVVKAEIKELGPDEAYERFSYRSETWIGEHRHGWVATREEAIAIAAFAAALSFINLLWSTGEVCNDTKH